MLESQSIQIRPVTRADVPLLFEMQLDPEGNHLAGTKPRTLEAFAAVWETILGDERTPPDAEVVARVIVEGDAATGAVIGVINVFPREGKDYVGYWIRRDWWGRGVASRALGLLLNECARRPLVAQVAAHNAASLRVLERAGFVVTARAHMPETERYTPGPVVTLVLR